MPHPVQRTYKAVVFDFGGVLMSFHQEIPSWSTLNDELGLPRGAIQDAMFGIFKDLPALEEQLFVGKVAAEQIEMDLLPTYLERKLQLQSGSLPRPLPLLNRWMGPAATIPMNEEMVGAAKAVKAHGLHTAILTNNYKMDIAGEHDRTPIDKSIFDVIVESTREGCMKPHTHIYKICQSRLPPSIAPHEVVFLDDNKKNISAAKAFGWRTIFVESGKIREAIDELQNLLQIPLL